jgi:hypothetical protein
MGTLGLYNRHGDPIGMEVYLTLLSDFDYKIVQQNALPNGRWVSTVWLGLDHSHSLGGPPLIFETMVFPSRDNFAEIWCERYATLEDAREGHERLLLAAGSDQWHGYDDE